MRTHRFALITITFIAALVVALPILAGTAAPLSMQEASWRSAIPTPLATEGHPEVEQQLGTSIEQFDNWIRAMANQQAAQAQVAATAQANAQAAAAVAASASLDSSMSSAGPVVAPSTPSPTGDNSTVWACIIQHESGGDPAAYNDSSGAAGLFQFELPTWLSASIADITDAYPDGAQTAPASVQWSAAEQYEAINGWGAWVGDGCTPLG